MINLFNRKKLIADTSSEEVNRIISLLKSHNIHYEIITKRSQSPIEMSFHANIGNKLGNGDYKTTEYCLGKITFVYIIYVNKKDYLDALNII